MKYLLIAGGRDFINYDLLKVHLAPYKGMEITVVSGTARGADQLGERWAMENGYAIVHFYPDWNGLGKKAGPLRNIRMAEFIEDKDDKEVVLFWDNKSRGTAHMYETAMKKGIKVTVVNY